MKLTIGMCCYDDYDGVWFTIQSILMYHADCIDELNFVVVDGNPESKHGIECEKLIAKLSNSSGSCGKYVKNISIPGTSSRNYIFEYAQTPYVLCLDSHVMVAPGGIRRLIEYYENNPDTPDLLQGPMLDDNGDIFATNMEPVWDYNMYGRWQKDISKLEETEPYEVEMQGLGLFSCKKDKWLKFNKHFRGFGGEEGYIHKKYKKSGYKTLILPWLKWNHRFARPNGVPYKNEYIDRIKNYLIGWNELGEDTKEIIDYYSKSNEIPGQHRDAIGKTRLQNLAKQLTPEVLDLNHSPHEQLHQQNSKLKERVMELEMKLMEMSFTGNKALIKKDMSFEEYESEITQQSKIHTLNTVQAHNDITESATESNNSTFIESDTPNNVRPLTPPPPATTTANYIDSFEQRLFQKPVEDIVNPPAAPPQPAPAF